jgi:5-deoxy-5-amino-3-dehydroquinate synthase
MGRIDDRGEERHRSVVGGFDLSPLLPHDADPERLTSFMERDKKAHHDLTFVLDGPEGVEVVAGVDRDLVVATLAAMDRTPPRGST